jgi:hypothetical protein
VARPRPRRAGARPALHVGRHGGGDAVEALVAVGAVEAELALALARAMAGIADGRLAALRGLPGALRRQGPAAGRGKKRLVALADWHFGGGDGYCAACPQACPDCPGRLSRPATVEGAQVWDLALRMGGQLRAVPGAVLGWDLGAGLALGLALGVPALAAAELLPAIEAVAVRSINERMSRDG